jgi:hypothetical protein
MQSADLDQTRVFEFARVWQSMHQSNGAQVQQCFPFSNDKYIRDK